MIRRPKPQGPTPERLLESARTHAPIRYDVMRGLERHREGVARGAPMPAWADGIVVGGKSWIGALLVKCIVGGVVLGGLVGVWRYAVQQPSAASGEPASMSARSESSPPQAMPLAAAAEPATSDLRSSETDAVRIDQSAIERSTSSNAMGPKPVQRARALDRPVRRAPSIHGIRANEAARSQPADSDAPGAPQAQASTEKSEPAPERASKPEPKPRATPAVPSDSDEMQQLARAERLLASDPARALALARSGDSSFPTGYFRQERAYLAIVALTQLGRTSEAASEAKHFFESYPGSPYRARIERALAQRSAGRR